MTFGTSIVYLDRFGESWGASFLTTVPEGTTDGEMWDLGIKRFFDWSHESYFSVYEIEKVKIYHAD